MRGVVAVISAFNSDGEDGEVEDVVGVVAVEHEKKGEEEEEEEEEEEVGVVMMGVDGAAVLARVGDDAINWDDSNPCEEEACSVRSASCVDGCVRE